jgi:hypothetical protein
MRVQNAFSTRDKEAQELTGGDFYKIVKQRKREEMLMQDVEDVKRQAEHEAMQNNTAP